MSRKTILPNISYDTQRRCYYAAMYVKDKKGGTPRRTTRCFPTLELAIQALDRYNAGKVLSQSTGAEVLTVGQWLTYWLEQVIAPSRTASTVHGYQMIIRNHLAPALGQIKLTELTLQQHNPQAPRSPAQRPGARPEAGTGEAQCGGTCSSPLLQPAGAPLLRL